MSPDRTHLANTTAIKQYDGLKHRGDESDARHLAHILRLGLLPEGHIMPKAERAVRDLARKSMQLVQQRTLQILSIETCLAQQTGARISSNSVKQLTATDIDAMPIGYAEALGLKANLAVMPALQTQIDGIEKALATHCRREAAYRLLNTVSGIGPVLAPPSSCLRRATSNDLPMSAIMRRTAAVSAVSMFRTAKRKAKAIPRTVTGIRHGLTSRQPILRFVIARRRANFTNAKRVSGMGSSRSRQWRTSWRMPASKC
jgi:hypothetical protein